MCGRYYTDPDTGEKILRITASHAPGIRQRSGDIRPSESAVIISGKKPGLYASEMRWGFPAKQSKQLIINARSETALDRPMFSESVLQRRCVIAAGGFYEWNQYREKVTFTMPDSPHLYMAGFFRSYEDGDHFIILTTAANASMRPVHDRMPLIIREDQIEDWIYNNDMTDGFLKSAPPLLSKSQETEQLSLF